MRAVRRGVRRHRLGDPAARRARSASPPSLLLALIAREAGRRRGRADPRRGRRARPRSRWSRTHLALTTGPDLLMWLLVILCAMRALLRQRPRYWLLAGLVSSGSRCTTNTSSSCCCWRSLAGVLILGPRRVAAVAVAVGRRRHRARRRAAQPAVPDHQRLPAADMAAALAENKGDDARITMIPLQLAWLGPLVRAGLDRGHRDAAAGSGAAPGSRVRAGVPADAGAPVRHRRPAVLHHRAAVGALRGRCGARRAARDPPGWILVAGAGRQRRPSRS